MLGGFLAAVLPAKAPYYAAFFMDRAGTPIQKAVESLEELIHITSIYGNKGYDTYFGLAGFTNTWHSDPQGRLNVDGTIKKVFRTQNNAHSVKAFWLDVDIGDKPSNYKNAVEVFNGLVTLCKETNLPLPTIVSSGKGFHLYWILSRPIYAKQWRKIAGILDAVVRYINFKADPARTCDIASAPRVVGTLNWKYTEPKEVKLISKSIETISPEEFASRLIEYATTHAISIAPPTGYDVNKFLPIPAEFKDSPQFALAMGHVINKSSVVVDKEPIPIVKNCQQVREAGKESEPAWFSMLTVMRHCKQGKEVAKVLSKIDPRFNEQEFEQKFSHVEGLAGGPATCERFNKECPNKCTTCSNWQKITSPAELGRIINISATNSTKAVANPLDYIENNVELKTRYEYTGKDFKQISGKGLFAVITEDKDGSTATREHFITSNCIYILYAQIHKVSHTETTVVYVCEIIDKNNKTRQVRFTAKDLKSSYAFREWMVNTQTLVTFGNEKFYGAFMQAYLSKLQGLVPQLSIKNHLGWTTVQNKNGDKQTGFILGNSLLGKNSSEVTIGLSPGVQDHADAVLTQAGTLETWKQIPEFYKQHNVLWGQLGVCAAFGAVLMKFAPGGAKNGILNFWSAKSGSGKTTLQRVINSVWGHQELQLINLVTTINARYMIMGWWHHLPLCINETTKMTDSDLSDALFQISEGREKDRKDGNKLQESGSWNTIAIMSANNPALDKLLNFASNRDAEIKRVLDIEAFKSDEVSRKESLKFDRTLETNYGHAGKYFIQALLNRPDFVSNIPKILDAWILKNVPAQDERFWASTIATTIIGGKLAKAFGLISFDMDEVEKFALQSISQMRTNFVTTKVNDAALLSDFLSDNLRNTLVVLSETRTTPANPAQAPEVDPYVRHMPTGQLDIRVELDTKSVYIRTAAFNEWCNKRNITARNVLRGLAVDGVYVGGAKGNMNKPTSVRIGRGVPILEHATARCYKFIMKAKNSVELDNMYDKIDSCNTV